MIVGGLALIRWLDQRNDHRATSPTATALPTTVPTGAQRVRVAFARDGDTLEANAVSAGTPIPTTERIIIRLLGIDAPEVHGANGRSQCYARDAYQALQRLTPNGSTAFVVADRQLHDQYQRYLVYVWNANGVFVNLELARLGFARPLSIAPNTARQTTIDRAVGDAEAARRGLWGVCVATPK